MAYLHENREEFTNAVNLASEWSIWKLMESMVKWLIYIR